MREIKFRVWDNDQLKFYFFDLFEIPLVVALQAPVTQFTCETDKDNKEIYEGDLVEVSTKPKKGYQHQGTVVWERGAWMVTFKDNDKFPFTRLLSNWAKDSTVTGNIYERP